MPRKLTQEEFVTKSIEKHGYKYSYDKVIYTGSRNKVTIICPIHGEFTMEPRMHLYGRGCPKCGMSYSTEEFIQKAQQIHGDKYDYSKVNYIRTDQDVEIICKKCNKSFFQKPYKHLQKHGCPRCNQSHGETEIESFLDLKSIKYIKQHKITGNFRNRTNIYVDFYIPEYNIFIEYNGEQHYVPIEHFGGELQFSEQQIRDQDLKNYCIENNIKLLEISYKDNVVEKLNYNFE